MTDVFLSWSGKRSQAMARALRGWLPTVMHDMKPWMSTDDIQKGRFWSVELSRSLKSHRVGIFCITPENYNAPWLIFEAGALSRFLGKGKVIPLFLGMASVPLDGPLGLFQSVTVEREDILGMLRSLNHESKEPIDENVLKNRFDKRWPEFLETMRAIAGQLIPGDNATLNNVVHILAQHGIAPSAFGNHIYFDGGFETHGLYSTLTEVAKKQLLVLGRKNRKLFDRDHFNFLKNLKARVAGGFDFRVLFLDPASPADVLRGAHYDDGFPAQLRACIDVAKENMCKFKLDVAGHCKTYRTHRTVSFVVVDDVVLYTSIFLDENGRARPLTRTSFTLIDKGAPLGVEMVASFENQWRVGHPLA